MFTTGMRSRTSSFKKEKDFIDQKSTLEDEDKVSSLNIFQKYKLIKKLTSHSAEQFR